MAIWRNTSSRKFTDGAPRRKSRTPRIGHRTLSMERFEERNLLAVGPQLVSIVRDSINPLTDNQIIKVAPNELAFRFTSAIDSDSLFAGNVANIQLTRGGDHILGNGNDVNVSVPYVALGSRSNDVILRFDSRLPDDLYEIRIIGAGSDPLRNTAGEAFNGGQDLTQRFTLDLGAQVVAVVPQPVTRNSTTNALSQATTQIDVFFNANDPLDAASATNRFNYQLIRTAATATTVDDQLFNPTTVTYDAASGKAVLTFAAGVLTTAGTYRLRIGSSEPLAIGPLTPFISGAPGTSFATAADLGVGGNAFPNPLGTQTIQVSDTITHVPTPVVFPGSPIEPGERDAFVEQHVIGNSNNDAIPVFFYNFKSNFGTLGNSPQFNLITPTQKQRVREAFSYFSHFLGVEFVETTAAGFTIATGNPRVVNPNAPATGVSALAGANLVVVNSQNEWGASEPGGSYFQIAMRKIGELLGLGNDFAAPALTVQGPGGESSLGTSLTAGEPVFPGDYDILYGRYRWPALGNDINVYKFSVARSGQLNLETFAERLASSGQASVPSQLDSVITLFDAAGNVISQNDDYFGKDSLIQLQVEAGTYFAAITSTGNSSFDPRVANSGFGGTTQGEYNLRLTFTPTVSATDSIRDLTGTRLDGDADGLEGGVHNFWFKVDGARTIFVDKASTGGSGPLGSITNPYTTISSALAAASSGSIMRIVGNGGTDRILGTVTDNLSYNIGFNSINQPLSDGSKLEIPQNVTVMIDAGAIIKLRGANIDVGSSTQGISRSLGALQVLGTPAKDAQGRDVGSVHFTSYYNSSIGTDPGTAKGTLAKGNWGGLVFRDDSDLEAAGIFLNYVNHAMLSYGGGQVSVNSVLAVYSPIHLETSRPTITYNTISNSADSAISANPNSFEETEVIGPLYHADYSRVGPRIYGNTLWQNSINALFIRIRTLNGQPLDPVTVNARFANTDIVHVLSEVLLINGEPGGFIDTGGGLAARPSARLALDPGIVMKMGGARIETEIGAQFIAEGTLDHPIIFTSMFDDRYGRSSSSDTSNDTTTATSAKGDWAGFFFGPLSIGSVDRAFIAYGGGTSAIEGGFAEFNVVEMNQAQVRITNSTFDNNAASGGGDRNGRSPSDASVIFIRGSQPVVLNNIIQNNEGAALSVNVNSLNAQRVNDWGRSRGRIDLAGSFITNTGPLIRNNRVGNNDVNGMLVRGGTITTNVTWDDTDIVHVVHSSIQTKNQQSLSGTLRLQSSPTESLVVKLLGTNVDIIASGQPLDISDRLGGSLQIVGTPNHPVVLTSLKDDTVGAGLTPEGLPQTDTLNRKGVVPPALPLLPTQGPVILDATARDVHGSSLAGLDGWDTLLREVNYIFSNSRVTVPEGREDTILYIGRGQPFPAGVALGETTTYSQEAIDWVADELNLTVEYAEFSNEIAGVNFSNYKMVYLPSHEAYPLPFFRADDYDDTDTWGGLADFQIDALIDRKADLLNYINNQGGGLLVMAQDSAAKPYGFLGPDPFIMRNSGGNVMTATALAPADWNTFGINDSDALNIGTPYRAAFEGSTNFNRLQPWAVDPVTGEIAMLGLAAGGVGIGPPRDVVSPADWGTVRLDTWTNDRNVEIINEVEQRFAATGDTNHLPTTAQFLGQLAKDLYSGDDEARLGFEIHGAISQAAVSPGGGDVDVYSFRGTAGRTVWLDIDRTTSALDSIVELVDANGAVIARSDNANAETSDNSLLVGSARPLQTGALLNPSGPFTNRDFYSSNPKDAGMRVNLPGAPDTVNTYFVRVRSSSTNLPNLTGGVTKGAYVLQIRLQELDEFPGSTVRYADVRFGTNGIEVIGKPEHSPLRGTTVQATQGDAFFGPQIGTSFDTAQEIGNLLTTDRTSITVGGELESPDQVQWFKMDLNYDLIESIAGLSDGLKTFAAMFSINYADGIGGPDTTISVFDANGNLILIGRDSDIVDALPRPFRGADTANLGHGSFGTLDATIGSVHLPAGVPDGNVGPQSYYIAVSSARMLPSILDATFELNASDPRVRLEPINSVARVVENRVESTGGTTAGGPLQGLSLSPVPYTLADTVLYLASENQLYTVNPFTGVLTSNVTPNGNTGPSFGGLTGDPVTTDIAMRDDGRMYAFARGLSNGTRTAAVHGTYGQFSPTDGHFMDAQTNELNALDIDPADPTNFTPPTTDRGVAIEALAFSRNSGFVDGVNLALDEFRNYVEGRLLYVVGSRTQIDLVEVDVTTDLPPEDPDDPLVKKTWREFAPHTKNLLFRLNPNTGAPFDDDLITNTTTNPPPGDTAPTAYQKSGTVVVPAGTLTTGVTMIAAAGSQIFDGAKFSIATSTQENLQHKFFEFDTGDGVAGTNVPIPFSATDSQFDIAARIAAVINAVKVPLPFGPRPVDLMGLPIQPPPITAVAQGANVVISGSRFATVDFPFRTDAIQHAGSLGGLRLDDFSPEITGLAFLQGATDYSLPENNLRAVSATGGFYSVSNYHPGGSQNNPQSTKDNATLTLLNLTGQTLSGLTPGPQYAGGGGSEFGGPYAFTLFSVNAGGRLFAFDSSGNPANVFQFGQSSVSLFTFADNFDYQGLAFSPLDFNLWHNTPTRGEDTGHGITESFDFDNTRNFVSASDTPRAGGESWYFGFESPDAVGGDDSIYKQPTAENYNREGLGGNRNLYGSYNLPGGALGSLQSSSFSLAGYSTADRPTLYFNYLLDVEGGSDDATDGPDSNVDQRPTDEDDPIGDQDLEGMRDSFRVYASSDGINWLPLVTNNSILSSQDTTDAELPAQISASGGNYRGDLANQRVQEAFDPPGVPGAAPPPGTNPFDEPAPTEGGLWRQARVDLGDFAGLENVRIRFDFSSAGSMGQGLAGDQFGEFSSTFYTVFRSPPGVLFLQVDDPGASLRRADNNHEGVRIDDVMVGLAGRGEMVTGHFNPVQQLLGNGSPGDTSFFDADPPPPPGSGEIQPVYTGGFQLTVRRGTDYAQSTSSTLPFIDLTKQFDVNDRLARGFSLVVPNFQFFGDGQTFTIDDGTSPLTFEFDTNGVLNDASRVRVATSNGATATQVAVSIRDTINDRFLNHGFKVSASMAIGANNQPTGGRVDLFDAVDVVNNSTLTVRFYGAPGGNPETGLGDTNDVLPPGQTLIQNNIVSDSRQVGIQVVPSIGQIRETGVAFTELSTFELGTPGNPGGIATQVTPNERGWVAGVTVKNNLVTFSGRTGIQVGGDPNAPYAYAQREDPFVDFRFNFPFFNSREVELFLPFVRVVNNTVYDARNGITASNASSPTILNNVIANTGVATGPVIKIAAAAINVDAASGASQTPPAGVTAKFGDTVVGFNLFQNNIFDVLGTGHTNPIFLTPAEPLFVDATKRNFYLAEGSRAIDSSRNSLEERDALQAVDLPLGMALSPILAPETDLLGQLRVDDPTVFPPPGAGSNVFKDRGAVERADFIGPTAALANPVDNDAGGIDRNRLPNHLLLVSPQLTDFRIQLLDGVGVGIDDSTVGLASLVIERTVGTVTEVLTPNVDYSVAYDTNNKIAQLIPADGIWTNGIYTLTLDNSVDPIKDLAGNALQANEPPATRFTIELTDTITSSWQNPINKFDVSGNGIVSGLDALLIINRLLEGQAGPLPPVATVPPYLDVSGDGNLSPLDVLQVINFLNTPGGLAAPASALSASPAAASPQTAAGDSATAPAAPIGVNGSAIAFSLSVDSAASAEGSFASTSIDVTSSAPSQPAAAPVGSAASADAVIATDDVWARDDWDATDDEWDGIASELLDELDPRGLGLV